MEHALRGKEIVVVLLAQHRPVGAPRLSGGDTAFLEGGEPQRGEVVERDVVFLVERDGCRVDAESRPDTARREALIGVDAGRVATDTLGEQSEEVRPASRIRSGIVDKPDEPENEVLGILHNPSFQSGTCRHHTTDLHHPPLPVLNGFSSIHCQAS